ncbi:MAG: hypothetical protein Q8T04_12010 [Bacteroidota bacterium]|nr:hypothetical protein [Bacteroidota bacterium]
MSEYQFYEFRAIDKPLSKEDKAQIGSWSSRTNPTNTGAIFTYNYGNFPKDEIAVVEKYFDAMFSISNWGTTRLIFKFPKNLLKLDRIKQYSTEDGLKIIEKSDFVILDIEYSEEGGGNWMEGEGWLTSLISLRDDILNEDYRCLYLIWIKNSIAAIEGGWGNINSDTYEPQVPEQLNELNGALNDFVEIFEIDKDYITVAVKNSKLNNVVKPIELALYLDRLCENEKQEFLVRLLNDEPFISIKLKTRLKDFIDISDISTMEESKRTIGEIMQKVNKIKRERKNKEKIEREEKQVQKMLKLEGQEIEIWAEVYRLIAEKNAKGYDGAIKLLKELKDLSIYKNRFSDFCNKLEMVRTKYSRLSGLTSRIMAAKLIALK